MARDLATTLTELDSAIHAENSAWAASRGHAENAHLAASFTAIYGDSVKAATRF